MNFLKILLLLAVWVGTAAVISAQESNLKQHFEAAEEAEKKGDLLNAYLNYHYAMTQAKKNSNRNDEKAAIFAMFRLQSPLKKEYAGFRDVISRQKAKIDSLEREGERYAEEIKDLKVKLAEQYRRSEAQRLTILALQEIEQGSAADALGLAYLADLIASKGAGLEHWAIARAFGDAVFQLRRRDTLLGASLLNAAFLPDGEKVLTVTENGVLSTWDKKTLQPYHTFSQAPYVLNAGYSGDYLYTTSTAADTSVRLWSLSGQRDFSVPQKHRSDVYGAQVAMNGQGLLTWSRDSTAHLWDMANDTTFTFSHEAPVQSARLNSPGGDLLLTRGTNNRVLIWNHKGSRVGEVSHEAYIYSAEFSPDGKYILTASADQSARLWEINRENSELKAEVRMEHQGLATKAIFNHSGTNILTTSTDSTATLWDLRGTELNTWDGHKGWVVDAAFSKNDSLALTRSKAGDVWIWDIANRSVFRLNGHRDKINQVVFSPDSRYVLTASNDRTAKLWDIQGNIVMDLNGFNSPVTHVDFSSDGYLLAAADDGTIIVSPLPETVRAELDQKPFKEIYSKVLQYGIDCDDWKTYLEIDLECP